MPEENTHIAAPAPDLLGSVVPTSSALAYEGGPGTGKTEALVLHVRQLTEEGSDPSKILVLAATPDAAQALSSRLSAACPATCALRICTPRELWLELLDLPEAKAVTGRDARLLAPFEVDFLMEDLKVSGKRPKRLREMSKFFFKAMADFSDDDAGEWLVTHEERNVFGYIKDCVGFTRGILEPELANFVVRFLQSDPLACARNAYDHVVVDDYQLLSRSSQLATNLLARRTIAIAFDKDACFEVFESYPFAAGPDEFLSANPSADITSLRQSRSCRASGRAVNVLRSDLAIVAEPLDVAECAGSEHVLELVGTDPLAEMDAAADYISQRIEDGVAPEDIVVASRNKVWTKNLAAALRLRGIAVEPSKDDRRVSGDIRDEEKCEAARVLTGLCLVANRQDGVAWRSWCGFGDWLTNSGACFSMRAYGKKHGMAIDAVLEAIASSRELERDLEIAAQSQGTRAIEAYRLGCDLVAGAEGREGNDLLSFVARFVLGERAQVPDQVKDLVAPLPSGDHEGQDAESMVLRARKRLALPAFETADVVRITTYERTCGLKPKVLLLCGFVNGFFPSSEYFDPVSSPPAVAEKRHALDTRIMAETASKPTETLAVSYFEQTTLETAEVLKVKLHRIKLIDKKRTALVEPSSFLAKMKA